MNKKQIALVAKEIATHHKGKPLAVLADVSDSMSDRAPSGLSKFMELRAALISSLARREDYSLVAFAGDVEMVESPAKLYNTGGSTRLANALRCVAKQGAERLLIVTDGHPTDSPPDSCLAVLDELFPWVRVDVLFIGPPDDSSATALLRRVARNGGVMYSTERHYLQSLTLLLEGRAL